MTPRPTGGWQYESWGRFPKSRPAGVVPLWWRHGLPNLADLDGSLLAFGRGRSYGDCCQNDGGWLLDTKGLSRFMAFDEETGVLECESGVTLAEVLRIVVPRGWILPVIPGTKYVTLGGAIANDIHGKNHHRAGCFGRHVRRLELLRSSGERIACSPTDHRDLFLATVGGLGLTGLILSAAVQLQRVTTPYIVSERVRYRDLGEFLDLSHASHASHEYTVAWVDCLAPPSQLGRGFFFRGNHLDGPPPRRARSAPNPAWRVPFDAPPRLLNPVTVRAFNAVYRGSQRRRSITRTVHYDPFFCPLDSLREWNRIYGRRGFLQYQCVVPFAADRDGLRAILSLIGKTGNPSFLAVLKVFGSAPPLGALSFARPGVTVALDFPFEGNRTLAMCDALDRIVRDVGGAVYPAKDARMSPEAFHEFFPNADRFAAFVDPRFSSGLWRRVRGMAA